MEIHDSEQLSDSELTLQASFPGRGAVLPSGGPQVVPWRVHEGPWISPLELISTTQARAVCEALHGGALEVERAKWLAVVVRTGCLRRWGQV